MKRYRGSGESEAITPEVIPLPKRSDNAANTPATGQLWGSQDAPERVHHHGATSGALQGDDYPLSYDENGYPELPGVS
jgi:hypothetical protein